jgi:putative N6-adenine-specific DNA methylase
VESPIASRLDLYVVTTPGLEELTRAELEALGLRPTGSEPGGLSFEGSLDDLARANLWLRTASRVLGRITSFHARALGELERKAAAVPWRSWLVPGVPVRLRVSCRKSRLYHQKAVAERIGRSLAAAGWEAVTGGAEPGEDGDEPDPGTGAPAQLLLVRIFRDDCTISLDSSGELLHRRGYRLASSKAPLRETLAAGLILASGWDPACPLLALRRLGHHSDRSGVDRAAHSTRPAPGVCVSALAFVEPRALEIAAGGGGCAVARQGPGGDPRERPG